MGWYALEGKTSTNHFRVEPTVPRFLVSLEVEVQASSSELALDAAIDSVVRREFRVRAIRRAGFPREESC